MSELFFHLSILLSTHNVDLAYEWADEVIVLNNGHLLAQGTAVEVFNKREILEKSHLQKPWIMEVFEKFQRTNLSNKKYPRSKAIKKNSMLTFEII